MIRTGIMHHREPLAAYCECLQKNDWPDFDPQGKQGLDAWSLIPLQPGMTAGNGPHGGYFAPRCVLLRGETTPSQGGNAPAN